MTASQWLFESFRLDPVNACLWWGAEAVVLTPKTFDVLHYLVRHAGRLVTKDELLDAVWPETAVSDGVVRMAISALRKALDDTAQTPRFIATQPLKQLRGWRNGYSMTRRARGHLRTRYRRGWTWARAGRVSRSLASLFSAPASHSSFSGRMRAN